MNVAADAIDAWWACRGQIGAAMCCRAQRVRPFIRHPIRRCRDHNAAGFSMWMAGGGVKGGHRYGATDEHSIAAVKDKMHINDLHATMLYLLGLDHEKLTYRYSGRDFRLTDLAGVVAKGVLA